MKIIKYIKFPIWWLLCRIPFCKYMSVGYQIDKLTSSGEIEKAKTLRRDWLNKMPEKYASAIWRSEGEFLLYEDENYPDSLSAFTKAISIHEEYASADNPLRMYYGAAVSAVMNYNMDEAEAYFNKFLSHYNEYRQIKNLQNYTNKFSDGVKWLREHIYGDGTRSHLKLVDNPYEP
ncbi:MAG: hypothetical protein C0623_13580 [Desulfuromonas sp.]|nr:MAG: hypothetical protein C0623_13580 [Desulfuromonas sp.]